MTRNTTLSMGLVLAYATAALTQSSQANVTLGPSTTLPITFPQTINANRVHVGDIILAKTMQATPLSNGEIIPSGAKVSAHVAKVQGFTFDKTPYAKQTDSVLAIQFDSVSSKTKTYPLNVYVRAMADPISSWDARKPRPSDEDPDGTLTQIGGELYKPHQGEVITMDEDVVGYSRHGNIVAHLIPAQGSSPDGCDGSDTEQPVAIFSANACGLYGFSGTKLLSSGRSGQPSTVILSARRNAAVIWKNSTALIETLPDSKAIASN